MIRMMSALTIIVGCQSGCATIKRGHPLEGSAHLSDANTGYYVWVTRPSIWHLRMAVGRDGKAHRFQGSLTGSRGGISELRTTRSDWSESVAVVGDAVQFDVALTQNDGPPGKFGFDVEVAGGCAQLDLYVDGRHEPERVWLGPRSDSPRHLPIERCP